MNVEDTIVEGEMGNIIMLNDIPGASLIGKAPSELSLKGGLHVVVLHF